MTPEKRAILMELWRKDVAEIVAGRWPRIPSERWAPLAPVGRKVGPVAAARHYEENQFIGRVMRRLQQRGLLLKEIGWLWGKNEFNTCRLIRKVRK